MNSGVIYISPHTSEFQYQTKRKVGCMDGSTFVDEIVLVIADPAGEYTSLGAITRSGQ